MVLSELTIYSADEVSSRQDPDAGAWTLRNTFEMFIYLFKQNYQPSYIDLHTACTNGYMEQVEIQTSLSGLVNEFKVCRVYFICCCYSFGIFLLASWY
jgi:hypothetical protein